MPNSDQTPHNGSIHKHRSPADAKRIALAVAPEPVENARYLLASIPLTPPQPPDAGPRPSMEFVVEIRGPVLMRAAELRAALAGADRRDLGFPQAWGQVSRTYGMTLMSQPWQVLAEIEDGSPVAVIALSWELAAMLVNDYAVAAAVLARRADEAGRLAAMLRWSAKPLESPASAASRAIRLIALKDRFARSVEMRLMPGGRRFPARSVWRAASALGLQWGELDLFHWREPSSGTRLFTLSAVGGGAGGFIPERASEGEAVAGLSLGFELPRNPVPLATYDRMAVALDYLRQNLWGRPTAPDGAELDGDRLWSDRDALAAAVAEMKEAGIAPGSAEAERFF